MWRFYTEDSPGLKVYVQIQEPPNKHLHSNLAFDTFNFIHSQNSALDFRHICHHQCCFCSSGRNTGGFNGRKLGGRASTGEQIISEAVDPSHCPCLYTHTKNLCILNFLNQHSAASSALVSEGVLCPGQSQLWLIDGTVAVIECVSSAVKPGQTRHTVLCIECVFVLRQTPASKLH